MSSDTAQDLTEELSAVLEEFGCIAGTMHCSDGDLLRLVAHVGIPAEVRQRVETVPVGKGMGGLAAERREPVQVCNLQTTESDVVESGAKATGLEGGIAAPMLGPDDALKGVIGIGKQDEYEFSATEEDRLLRLGGRIAEDW